jgi:von Willebrand factor type A domain-containing protein/putative metal-binding protein
MKYALASLLSFTIACSSDELHPVCGNVSGGCYAVWNEDGYKDPQLTSRWEADEFLELAKKGLVGECKLGIPTCDKDYNVIDCQGAVYPEQDKCDGKDNDCDGGKDNGYYPSRSSSWSYEEPNPCTSIHGVCSNAKIECINGRFECDYPDTYEGAETRCDGLDNDCDGRVDHDVFSDLPLSERVCYSGNPIETLGTPPCRAGLYECLFGEVICRNEIIPSRELCDTIDNDCNGFTDDTGDVMSTQYDIVFIIDTSGSMCDEIAAVAGACSAYAEQFDGNPNFRFALVIMSENSAPYVQVDTDFTDFSNIRSRLLSLGCNGGWAEASMDSMLDVCDQTTNTLDLSWRDTANPLFFMFTDENQQTYRTPPTTGQAVIDACVWSGTLPFIWSRYPADFEYVAQGANGAHFTLVNDWATIFDDMKSIVVTLCGIVNEQD